MSRVIQRNIASELRQLLGEYPVVTVLGPRQAGKTTLVRYVLIQRNMMTTNTATWKALKPANLPWMIPRHSSRGSGAT